MRVGVGDLARAPHEVLEVLPAHSGGEVLHDHPVLGPGGRAILLQPDRPVLPPPSSSPIPAPAPGSPAVPAPAPPVLVPPVRRPLGQLAGDPEATTVTAVFMTAW